MDDGAEDWDMPVVGTTSSHVRGPSSGSEDEPALAARDNNFGATSLPVVAANGRRRDDVFVMQQADAEKPQLRR